VDHAGPELQEQVPEWPHRPEEHPLFIVNAPRTGTSPASRTSSELEGDRNGRTYASTRPLRAAETVPWARTSCAGSSSRSRSSSGSRSSAFHRPVLAPGSLRGSTAGAVPVAGTDQPSGSAEARRHELGLTNRSIRRSWNGQPVPGRYLTWLSGAVHGDFGFSVKSHRPVIEEILTRIPPTHRRSWAPRSADRPLRGHPVRGHSLPCASTPS
jgi:hypothetical protein